MKLPRLRRIGRIAITLLACIGGLLSSVPASADVQIAVIVGLKPPHIAFNRNTLADIFLKRIQVDDDRAPLVPLNLSPINPLRTAFSLSLLGERPSALERYWTERYFHGIAPPYTVRSQEAMLRFVAKTPGAVGYVLSCRVDPRVRVVARLPVPKAFASQVHHLCDQPRPHGP